MSLNELKCLLATLRRHHCSHDSIHGLSNDDVLSKTILRLQTGRLMLAFAAKRLSG
jgi:hypothetical protein